MMEPGRVHQEQSVGGGDQRQCPAARLRVGREPHNDRHQRRDDVDQAELTHWRQRTGRAGVQTGDDENYQAPRKKGFGVQEPPCAQPPDASGHDHSNPEGCPPLRECRVLTQAPRK